MLKFNAVTILSLLMLALAVTACSTTGGDDVRRLEAPSYATRTGSETYSVSCGGGRNITIRRSSMDDFYHDNGEMKTLSAFCEEFDPGSLIRKK